MTISHRASYVLDVIVRLMHDRGYPPSFREIQHAAGLTTVSAVRPVLDELKEAGDLTFTPGVGRSLVLKGEGNRA